MAWFQLENLPVAHDYAPGAEPPLIARLLETLAWLASEHLELMLTAAGLVLLTLTLMRRLIRRGGRRAEDEPAADAISLRNLRRRRMRAPAFSSEDETRARDAGAGAPDGAAAGL